MTRETKFGFLFVLVLTGVFGMLVYKRMHQPADLVAGTNDTQEVTPETKETPESKSPTTTPSPELATNTSPSSTAGGDPFDLSPPVKPTTPVRPEPRSPAVNAAPALADFDTSLTAKPTTPAKPKLPTNVPDDDFFSPPATTTTARSTVPSTAAVDPFADDSTFATKPPSMTTTPVKAAVAASSTAAASTPADAPFDPFADPMPTVNTTAPQPTTSSASAASETSDPFADAPALVETPAAQPAETAMPAESQPVDDDPFMSPATVSAPVAEIAEPQPPALEFDNSARPVATETAEAPDLGFEDIPVAMQPARPVTSAPTAAPAEPLDDPFATTPEVKISTRTTADMPTPVEELPSIDAPMRPSLPVEVPEENVAARPISSRPAEFPDLEPTKVATTAPSLMPTEVPPVSQPPATTAEPDPFGISLGETEFPAAKPISVPARSAPVASLSSGLATNTGTYEVQLTDSFWTISKQVYGTGRYYQALAKHNAAIVSDPQKLKPGSRVETPPADILETRYRAEIPLAAAGTASNPSSTDLESGFFVDAAGKAMYRVGSNDTLSSISKAHLGRASRWIQIFEMNRQILKDGNTLKVGTELQLPADASQVQMVDFQQPSR